MLLVMQFLRLYHALLIACQGQVSSGQHIQLILLSIQASELEPEDRASDEGNDRHGAIVPHE